MIRSAPRARLPATIVAIATAGAVLAACGGGGGGASGRGGAAAGTSGAAGTAGAGGGASGGAAGASGGTAGTGGAAGSSGAAGAWVLGYWAVWQTKQYPLDRIAWHDLTHAAISFVGARAPATPSAQSPYATLDTSNAMANLGADGMARFAAAAHAGGCHPLMSLGGGGAGAGVAAAATAANRAQLVADIVAASAAWGYDGVDLDWEDAINYPDFQALVLALRAAAPPGFLLTVPVGAVNNNLGIDTAARQLWTAVHPSLDQLNVMTYTGSGNYPGWVVWFMDPLAGAGSDHPFDVTSSLTAYAALGIPKAKLGVGVGFYGRAVSAPVTAPLQPYGSATVYGDDTALSYGNIKRYFEGKGGAVAHWDSTAQTTWLSWPAEFHPGWTDQFAGDQGPATQFLTYEDPATVAAKGQWLKANGYGGVIIWTINEGTQFPYGADGYANPLLDAT
ncbi:MAG TPA: glycoside hydrolase family 18 protein, partial [Polyangia bacterium]